MKKTLDKRNPSGKLNLSLKCNHDMRLSSIRVFSTLSNQLYGGVAIIGLTEAIKGSVLRIGRMATRSHVADKKLQSHNRHTIEKFIKDEYSADLASDVRGCFYTFA